ncbi:uncharacterized protein LOC108154461 [Drosophila miranda]|uniref:uncharacterized protein LOC108154461 n=1 Tax=Drosophila miranda TaxID=7229 RepID=UPI0007E7B928|nr:uncharacterized protein LOC108154461 [Drosophila miranda]
MHRCYSRGNFGAGSAMRSSIVQPQPPQQQTQHQRPRGDLMSVTSSSRQSTRPTQFVRRPSIRSSAPGLGLGHSSTGLSNDFSRRNSTATLVSHCSSCSCSSSQQRQQSRAKVLRWGWERTGGVDSNTSSRIASSSTSSSPQYTDNRRFYEQSACALQQAYDKLQRTNTNADKWHKNRANEANRQQQLNSTTATPYALRQKMLQLRLQAEEKQGRGSGATCAPLGRSCALRYN